MADYLNNVGLADKYADASTLGPSDLYDHASILIANNPALMQFAPARKLGEPKASFDEREYLSTTQTFIVRNISGLRARNAISGQQARIIAILSGPKDISFESGNPFTAVLSASGGVAALVGVVVGAVTGYSGSTDPSGWLICDGRAVSRTIYVALFGVISTIYGPGDGSTTFNIPDLRGRMLVGLGPHADVSTLGASDGLAGGNRRPAHKHTVGVDSPDHAHGLPETGGGATAFRMFSGADFLDNNAGPSGGATARHSHTVGPQTGAEPTDSPAYQVLNYIIATGV